MSKPKRRGGKGLFGLQKKKSILFTFQPREGEEYSSDSEDSDYVPGRHSSDEGEELPLNQVKKRVRKENVKHNKVQSGKKLRNSARSSVEQCTVSNDDTMTVRLPDEILLRIFQFCVLNEGISKFLPRISRVCKDWNRLSHDPTLFEKLDLSASQLQLTKTLPKGLLENDLSLCKSLSLSGQTKLQNSIIESLLTSTPALVSLDVFNCPTIKPELVKRLPQLCPCLSHVDLSHSNDFNTSITISSIEVLITACGLRLVELRLARILAVKNNMKSLFKLLQDNCPNLEELDLRMNPRFPQAVSPHCYVDMVGFIKGCPKLKELRLDGVNICEKLETKKPYEPTLINLKTFSQSAVLCDTSVQPIFYLMFGPDCRLTELNISSSNLVPTEIIDFVTEVESCYMADMKWKSVEVMILYECLSKWCTSLRVLDLSYNKLNEILDTGLGAYKLSNGVSYPLEVLNLSNTVVSSNVVIQMIKSCKGLVSIDLTACRELPRGTKRIFQKNEFRTLLKILSGAGSGEDTDSG
ncbi:F-box/LRR-repeat protein 6-like [Biomphalaria glabrata]|uniref:F-box/LRR-repeat protein 6-like n=1 Tax=Biomphalaria glabrata TaxID=6526 RepID=A0A9W3BF44_BIOGL|nr:F-box/LRR-repeat protein 6-like [Biomphalaria glabrata]XP_055898198.1 F-box/LRR-repeat protein 6-like [Biomphalaria glabrata]XP_055898199.1 F-box/LRR-repeat protein 6-like [Biomphalaria glabrata]XP_055898200.1 F-box/LRR-repeat protein 6-like [Biomphalaria glabrata]KAI8779083.1 F-box/LRR-repeat protein 6 [Biomphalaria glabrata]